MTNPVRIIFLGGLGEVGRNCACIEIDNRIMILDCGLMFPDSTDMPGVDLVLPDFTYLKENASRIEGAILTHAHEDHVGALSYLLRDVKFPLYGSELTLGFAKSRIDEARLSDRTSYNVVFDNERRQIGPFEVEFIPVTHSVPHGFATAFHTPHGVVLHSGDFKIDLHPIDGRLTDLGRIGYLANTKRIAVLLSDSTNAENAGFTPSESTVGDTLRQLFGEHTDKRIITACFASHIHRVQQIANAAIANGRVVATLGRSMANNVALARQMGLLTIPDAALVDIEKIDSLDPRRVCIISTGSQGEPMSALSKMANGDSNFVTVGEGDVVILSSHAIPGNEGSVNRVIDRLMRRDVQVVHSGIADVHVSGHARQGELAVLLNVAQPEWFVPVHGEYRQLWHHAQLAERMGVAKDHIKMSLDGDVLELDETGLRKVGEVPSAYLYVDGIVGEMSEGVLRDRQMLADDGVVMVVLTVDVHAGKLVAGPEIITRGWVHAEEAEDLIDEAAAVVRGDIENSGALTAGADVAEIQRRARRALGKFVNERTKRRPMIVPVIMEV